MFEKWGSRAQYRNVHILTPLFPVELLRNIYIVDLNGLYITLRIKVDFTINSNGNLKYIMANAMKVQRTKQGQYVITIPKAFAEAMEFEQGTVLEFKLSERGELVLRKKLQ